ncbi:MAG TPA: Hpt domain-containing protein [Stellaceae bacterium]|nr:Hpt domain-containing protein [Stellaceae bacterium]
MSQVLDAEVLDVLIEAIGDDAARGVIALFLDECRELTAAIAAPGAAPVAIGRAAHSLKSSSGQLGATALSEAALAVETAASTGAPELPQFIAGLSACASTTREALAARLK